MHYTGQDMLWLIGSLSRIFRIPFDPQLIRQQFPPPYSRTSLLNALQALEFKVGERNLDAKTLVSLEHIPFQPSPSCVIARLPKIRHNPSRTSPLQTHKMKLQHQSKSNPS